MIMDYTYLILILPALIFSIWAQARVKSAFQKYSAVRAGMSGMAAAQMVLRSGEVADVAVRPISGNLTDNYDPRSKVISLSQPVYGADSVAAVGVAAHEAGHAVQYARGYAPVKVRNAVIPVSQFGAAFSWPLLMLGLLLSSQKLMLVGILLFSAAVLFQLLTLPVEFDASRRALRALEDCGRFSETELDGARKVLRAAALTYVAALAVSAAQLLRLLMIFGGNGRRRR
ncbi:MAG: zinc metallopeptidase [Clostridia bacterium]|nr:zinc metallopeptidase [Clostridia bacterium]